MQAGGPGAGLASGSAVPAFPSPDLPPLPTATSSPSNPYFSPNEDNSRRSSTLQNEYAVASSPSNLRSEYSPRPLSSNLASPSSQLSFNNSSSSPASNNNHYYTSPSTNFQQSNASTTAGQAHSPDEALEALTSPVVNNQAQYNLQNQDEEPSYHYNSTSDRRSRQHSFDEPSAGAAVAPNSDPYEQSPSAHQQSYNASQIPYPSSSPSSMSLARERRPSVSSSSNGGHGEGLGLGSMQHHHHQQSIGGVGRGSVSTTGGGNNDDFLPDTGFDEGILLGLCEMDCGMPLLLDRMKQSIASSSEAATFFKKRAAIEEEYARSMIKLARSSSQAYGVSEGKAGTFVNSWVSILRTHELVGDNRLKFAAQLAEMSEELVTLGKEVDKNRKASKELGNRLERGLADQETLVDKARNRFDSAAEELERLLLLKQGESLKDNTLPHASSSSGMGSSTSSNKRTFGKAMSKLKGPKNAAQVAKQEEEVRMRMGQTSDALRSQVIGAQAVRQEYFNLQLPRILRTLKESTDEVDLGLQYHLSRYAYIFESTLVTDGLTIAPVSTDDGPGLKGLVDSIDTRDDFKQYMQQYAVSWQMSGQRGPRREGPNEEGIMTSAMTKPVLTPRSSALAMSHQFASASLASPTFGVDLGDQMARDGVEVPRVLEKCCEAIELHGLSSMGIYRLSGTTSRVQRLKSALDRDIEGTDLLSEENLTDINDIAAVMKLWFRELPEPLLTWELYQGFIEAAKIDNDRLRHIRLHERVNDLPDPNYATLKFLMGHLDKVRQNESVNQMGCSNIAIVFGPNLLGAPPNGGGGSALADMSWQCKCVETILQHYVEIFVETDG